MKKIVGVASIVLAAVVFSGSDATAGGDPLSAGAETFAAKCASCHAKDGSGNTPVGKKMAVRNLGSAEVQKQTDQQLYDVTAKGKKKMPAYEKKLSTEQITNLVAYMRSLAKT
ncbi:MAG TPA: cytochrome c [Thermoanaerobaculia bacterium]|jgi:mono/diheme cytochrome c family protein|nr:cytochrome c [Thermoanaerobaculia bacterium]